MDPRFTIGIDKAILYLKSGISKAWNGVVSVTEKTENVNETFIFVDGQKHRSKVSLGDFAGSIEAYTYPSELEDPTQEYGFIYRVGLGRTIDGVVDSYEIHIVYNARFTPTTRDYSTENDTVNTTTFGWDITTRPQVNSETRPSAHIIIDSTKVNPGVMADLEALLYGHESAAPYFPPIVELIDFFDVRAIFRVVDHGDGTFTVTGPDVAVSPSGVDLWTLDWVSVIEIDDPLYKVSSY